MTYIENPMIRWKEEQPRVIAKDVFGNAVWTGDEILVIDDDIYRKDDLSYDAIKILFRYGAVEKVAGMDS